MAPQLHFLGKKLFMQHILSKNKDEDDQCFLRSLLINKRFLNIANNHRIYKVSISPNSENWIHLYFESYTESSSCYYRDSTFEFGCELLKLLKPSFTEFYYNDIFGEGGCNADCLFTLMQLASANGKASLRIHERKEEDFSNILERVYEHVDELTCFNKLLMRADNVKFKLLDKLDVYSIKSNKQLNAVLKHPTKRLDLEFSLDYFDGDESIHFHKNEAKQCKLLFASLKDVGQSYPIIQNVINACEKLETLDLIYYNRFDHDVPTFAMLLDEISQHYQMFTTLIELIRQYYSNLRLNITSNIRQEWRKPKIKLPEDWQKQVKQIGILQNAEIEEILEEKHLQINKKIKISSKLMDNPLKNSTFCLCVCLNDEEDME